MSFSYDDLHRLTPEHCQQAQGWYRVRYDYYYGFDAVGNRTNKYEYDFDAQEWKQRWAYNHSPRNELLGMDESWEESGDEYHRYWQLFYDLRGNLTKKQGFRGQDTKFAVKGRLTAGAADASFGSD